jgi:hypothetical protein
MTTQTRQTALPPQQQEEERTWKTSIPEIPFAIWIACAIQQQRE